MRLPGSTYRIQLGTGFTLEHARSLVDYLAALGVEYLYLSPVLAARQGSTHGYDVVDPRRVDPELGSKDDIAQLHKALRRHGMGLLLDIVPNHMAADAANPWWFDVLEKGRDSRYAEFFDIDWSAGGPGLAGHLLLPILGADPEQVVARGELCPVREGGALRLSYFNHRLPLCAQSWPLLLEPALERAEGAAGLGAIVDRCRALRGLDAVGRRRESDAVREQLSTLLLSDTAARDAVDAALIEIARDPTRLASLLNEQHYRPRFWRGPLPLNYRRFFDVSGLVGLRVEVAHVFAESHALLLELVAGGLVQGLRIDHPDGLLDPEAYLERLAGAVAEARTDDSFLIVVEKILTGSECLRESWPVAGTTGYEQLELLGGVLLDPGGREGILEAYARFTGETTDFAEVLFDSKRHALRHLLVPELEALVRALSALLPRPAPPDDELREGLSTVIACFDAYRSYVRPGAVDVGGEDRRLIEEAIAAAEKREAPALDAIRSALLLEPPVAHNDESRAGCLGLLLDFQQLSGPAAAKGVEDTACYRYVPLSCLDEVGGQPDRFGVSIEEFHAHNGRRAANWPGSLSASSTHDTKRSEDVRCRIGVLSEMPGRWAEAISRWHAENAARGPAPSANDEYLLYQTLVGTWPTGALDDAGLVALGERISAYMLKASREAKLRTSWVDSDPAYEAALSGFVARLFDRERSDRFLADLDRFTQPVACAGMLASLSMLVLKLAGPGIPDFYQGSELWDSSLVDPDNRRSVDFAHRRALLEELSAGPDVASLLENITDGRLKLLLTARGLELRRRRAGLLASGTYHAAAIRGERAEQVIAFARVQGGDAVLAAVGRFFSRFGRTAPIAGAFGDSTLELPQALPRGRYRDVFTGREIALESRTRISVLFEQLPYILMERIT